MSDPSPGAAGILARGAKRGLAVEDFGPVWDGARLRLSRAGWLAAGLGPLLGMAVPYVSTSSGRLSADAVAAALAALPDRPGLRILELASGSGVFARLFLDALRREAPEVYARSTYVVTDGSEGILAAQAAHGILDTHPGRVERMRLDLTADWPDLGRFDVILATYALDSLPFDFLALNGAATWRREVRAYLPEGQEATADRLRAALAEGTEAALAPFFRLGPTLAHHTRHVPVDRAALPQAAHLPDDTGGVTLPYVHSWGPLACLHSAADRLTEGGVVIFSDYGHLVPYGPRDTPEFQGYGTSVAIGLNFPQIEAAFADRPGRTLFRPVEDDGHLYTRVLRRGDGPDLGPLVDDLYGALRYRALHATVDAARQMLRGRLYEAARRYYGMALERLPQDWALMQEIAGLLHLAAGEPQDAADMASLGLGLNPVSPELWRILAEARLELGDAEGARAAADRGVALAPAHVAAQTALARVALHQQDHAAALRAVAEAFLHDTEGDSQDSLLAIQAQVLASQARGQIRVLMASANPFRALDTPPEE